MIRNERRSHVVNVAPRNARGRCTAGGRAWRTRAGPSARAPMPPGAITPPAGASFHLSPQTGTKELGRAAMLISGDDFRRAGDNDTASIVSRAGSHVDDPVAACH